VASPQSVAVDVFGKNYVTNTTFDPTRLSKNISYGIVPSNTSLFVVYRTTNNTNSNVAAGALNMVVSPILEYENKSVLSATQTNYLASTLEVSNTNPITGDVTNPSTSEIKRRIYDTFPTQNRAVTQADYESIAYRMPAKYGSIKRCTVIKDQSSLKRNLNMYVVSENSFNKLALTNNTIKQNLQTWLNNYRMVNDTIDILDPYIINLGVDFVLKLKPGKSRADIQALAVDKIRKLFAEGFFVGESMFISSVYTALKEIESVLDVSSVKINNKSGGQYSPTTFVINKNMSPDGTQLLCPANAIFEIKYPEVDIRGKIK
jgi:regulator of replication initiation timing